MHEKAGRIEYLDHLRVFATLAVILVHVCAQNWPNVDVAGNEWAVLNAADSFVRWSVPVFVMISGVLFLGREIKLSRLYSKYILRLVTAFIIWSAIYAMTVSGSAAKRFIFFIHGYYHMWFIPMIIGLYMCVPLLKPIVEKRGRTGYFLMLALIFASVIPEAIALVNDFGSPGMINAAAAAASDIENAGLGIVMGYSGYFVLGYAISRVSFSRRQRTVIYILGIAGAAATLVLTRMASLSMQSAVDHYYDYLTVNVLLESAAVFTWFKYRRYEKKSFNRLIKKLSKYSFGVYLVHPLVLRQLDKQLGLNTLSLSSPVTGLIVVFLIVAVISFLISAVLNHIPVIRKYMV
jgi:surface polysaccharide O-acyltransferase-like enzyme